jgi:Carboxypeptidase regulatory-like domain
MTSTLALALAATLTMHIDLARSDRASQISVTLLSLHDGSTTVATRPITAIDQLEQQSLAPGAYEVTVAADHHRSASRRIVARAGETTTLGVIALTPLPQIRGRVTGAPGATVRVAGDEHRTPVAAGGTFAIEIAANMPEYLIVDAPHRGSRAIALPQHIGDVELPPVALTEPSALAVSVQRPAGQHQPLELLVGEPVANDAPHWLARHRLGERASSYTFDALAAGSYTLLVRGEGPLQQTATRVALAPHSTSRVTLAIAPQPVDADVRLGANPLPQARVKLIQPELGWIAQLTADDAGHWHGEAWQLGAFVARVTAPSIETSLGVPATIARHTTIVLPAIAVRGRVVDSASGAPVAGASLSLRSESDAESAVLHGTSGADGRFAFASVPAGHQTLNIRVPGYLSPEPSTFDLSSGSKEIDMRLASGVPLDVAVRDTHAAAVAGARMACARDGRMRSIAISDENGRATMAVPRDGCVLFTIPIDAPFAVTRVTPSMLGNPLTVTIPRGSGSLAVATKTESGAPVAGVRLLVRYDGELVPPEVAATIERAQGLAFATDDGGTATLPSLPLGVYELWPYRTQDEAAQLVASGPMAAPIQLQLKSGENRVTLKFRAR